MKSQRRFAPKGGRIESESVAGLAGISSRLSRASKKVYSEYLKSQGIAEGIQSYNRLILLVSAWKNKNRTP